MVKLSELTDENLDKMALEIEALCDARNADELYEMIGNVLYNEGLAIADTEDLQLVPVMYSADKEDFNIIKIADYVMDTKPISKNRAKKEGKKFRDKLKKMICSNSTITGYFSKDGNLKEGIKFISSILSKTIPISPIILVIIAAAIALILKVGINKYCGLPSKN